MAPRPGGHAAVTTDPAGQQADAADPAGQQPDGADPAGHATVTTDPAGHAAVTTDPAGQQADAADPAGQQADAADPAGQQADATDPAGHAAVTTDPAGEQVSVFVARPAAIDLQRRLAADRRGEEVSAAHRHAAEYWLWRVAAIQQDRRADIHDFLEARHHLLAADDPRQAEAVTEGVCAQLHASGALDQEASLIRDTLVWLPHRSPRRAAWIHRLGKIAQMQGDPVAAGRRYQQALELFSKLADSAGIASVRYDLAVLAQGTANYLEAERRHQQAIGLGPDAAARADRSRTHGRNDREPAAARGGTPDARSGAQLPATGTGVLALLRWAAMTAGVLAMTAGLLTLVVDPNITSSRAAPSRPAAQSSGALGSAAALRSRVAAWISGQVSKDAIVACDPVMCEALRASGLPAGSILVLRPGASDPLGSDVVVATTAVRTQFGDRLASVYAPAIIASLGSGGNRIDVRAIAPDGAASYRAELAADQVARRQAGAQLLRNPRITFSATSRKQLAAGLADSRLLMTLAALAQLRAVHVVALGGSAPGASAGIPLYSAELTAGRPASGTPATNRFAGSGDAGFQAAILAFLNAQRPPFLAAAALAVRLPGGQPAVRFAFSAPSPLGLLNLPSALIQNNRKATPKAR